MSATSAGRIAGAALPSAFGVLMVAAAAAGLRGADIAAGGCAAVALAAVLVAARWAPAASAAVLATVSSVALSAPPPMFAALSGLAGTAYLVLRHGRGAASTATMIAAVGFAALAALAVAVPVDVAWLPLAAPLALLGAYLLAVHPYLR